jgi:viroplasmin and RNaseH domain-containing protein
MIPRYKPATRVGRFNYYAVKRRYKCGLFLSWLDCERQVRGYSGSQFKGFQRKEEAENYLLA